MILYVELSEGSVEMEAFTSYKSAILYVELSEGAVEMEAFTSYKGVPKRVPKPALQLLADRWSWLPLETPCREMR